MAEEIEVREITLKLKAEELNLENLLIRKVEIEENILDKTEKISGMKENIEKIKGLYASNTR